MNMIQTFPNENAKPVILRFFDLSEIRARRKEKIKRNKNTCTIYPTGKLFFTKSAQKLLNISEHSNFRLATLHTPNDEKKIIAHTLYFSISDEIDYAFNYNTEGIKFVKQTQGDIYYVDLAYFFKSIGLDFKSNKITFDILPASFQSRNPIYQLRINIQQRRKYSKKLN